MLWLANHNSRRSGSLTDFRGQIWFLSVMLHCTCVSAIDRTSTNPFNRTAEGHCELLRNIPSYRLLRYQRRSRHVAILQHDNPFHLPDGFDIARHPHGRRSKEKNELINIVAALPWKACSCCGHPGQDRQPRWWCRSRKGWRRRVSTGVGRMSRQDETACQQ